jgi:hypothetical protein
MASTHSGADRTFVHRALLCAVAGAAIALAGAAQAAPPAGVTYQGLGLDASGVPIQGEQSVLIRIYTDPISTAPADLVYQETHPAVAFVDGVFSVVIGSGTAPIGAFGPETFDTADLWLETGVAGEILSPRVKLQSVPYALQCANADSIGGANVDSFVSGVTAGVGLAGGGTGGNIELSVDSTQIQRRIAAACPAGSSIRQVSEDGSVVCETGASGDITGVSPGSGLTGGGASGNVSLGIAAGGVTGAMIATATVTGANIANDTITALDIATGAVGSAEIAALSVTGGDVAQQTLTSLNIADDSLADVDMVDEPGVEFASGGQLERVGTTPEVVRSMVLDAPTDGFVIVTATGTFYSQNTTTLGSGECGITTGTTIESTHRVGGDGGDIVEDIEIPFAATRVYVVAAGNTTFNLVCAESAGSGSTIDIADSSLTALFVPTRY